MFMKNYTKDTLRIFRKHIHKYRLAVMFAIVLIVITNIIELLVPIFYKQFFDLVVSSGSPIDKADPLLGILYLIITVDFIGMLLHFITGLLNTRWATATMRDLANTCFTYLHRHSFSFFDNNFVGSLVKRVNAFYHAFNGISTIILSELVPLVVNVVVVAIVLFIKNIIFGLIIAVWTVIFVLVSLFISGVLHRYYYRRSLVDSEVTGYLADTVTNQGNVKLFTGLLREQEGFAEVTGRQRNARRLTWDLSNYSERIQAALMISLEFFVLYLAIQSWVNGTLSVGDLVLIQSYLLLIFHRFWNLGRHLRDIYEQLAEAEEMTQILITPHEITDRKGATELRVQQGKIEFRNVSFYYYKTRKVIDRLSFTVNAGERLALVGPSGAGKSTIVKLMLRVHDVTGGQILIDGQRISHITQDSLHAQTSLVPQDPILFHRALMENIRYGRPIATDEEIVEAAKLAHCNEFIRDFPEKYATYVGERGVKLSGGERQRVAIARAILRNAPILILDEATSSLDSESERLIQEALDVLMRGKTVIVIAHRLSTIMKMDRILVIDGGEIVEEGRHAQLVRKKQGLYRRLWQTQVGGFIE